MGALNASNQRIPIGKVGGELIQGNDDVGTVLLLSLYFSNVYLLYLWELRLKEGYF